MISFDNFDEWTQIEHTQKANGWNLVILSWRKRRFEMEFYIRNQVDGLNFEYLTEPYNVYLLFS